MYNTLTLGWELEVEALAIDNDNDYFEIVDAARTIAEAHLPDNLLREVKPDGSLLNDGAELVSSPATLAAWHRAEPSVRSMLRAFQTDSGQWRSWNGGACGLHIHVGRNELSAEALVRLLTLVYTNTDHWVRESGRRDTYWCPFDVKLDQLLREVPEAKAEGRRWDTSGRSAVHLSSHNTVEFRFWRGSLKRDRFFRSLEATHAIAAFAAMESGPVTIDAYHTFVHDHAGNYPTLAATIPTLTGA